MSDKIKSDALLMEYRGIQIRYLEDVNKWRFELRGRERKADSLKNAKEWIDKPEPAKKPSKPFERFECFHDSSWYVNTEKSVEIVTVTSVALDTYRNTNLPSAAWILQDGQRSKVAVDTLLEISDDTKQKLIEVNAMFAEAKKLKEKAELIFKSIKRVDLKKYVDNGDE